MPETLASYPFPVVRLACTMCNRSGSYRLANQVAKYGGEIALSDLLAQLAGASSGWSVLGKFDGEFSSTTAIFSGTGSLRKVW